MANEQSRAEYLKALLNQKNNIQANGSNLVNPSLNNSDISQMASMNTSYVNKEATNFKPNEQQKEQNTESVLSKLFGTIDELTSKFGAGFVGGWEGILDLGATGLGWITGNKAFTDWAKQDLGSATAEWIKTYANFTPWGIASNIANGNYGSANYWRNAGAGFYDILDAGLFGALGNGGQLNHNYREDANQFYTLNDDWVNNSQVGQFAGGIASSIGQMLPAIMTAGASAGAGASQTVAKGVSLATLGLSAGGKQSESALNEGASSGKALLSGAISGGVEVVSEIVVGKALSGIASKLGIADKLGEFGRINGVSFSKEVVKKATAKQLFTTAIEEGSEEVFSEIFAPFIEAIYKGDKAFYDEKGKSIYAGQWWKNAGESFLSGAITGVLTEGTQTASRYAKYGKSGVAFGENVSELRQLREDYNNAKFKNESTTEIENKAKKLVESMQQQLIDMANDPKEKTHLRNLMEAYFGNSETSKAIKKGTLSYEDVTAERVNAFTEDIGKPLYKTLVDSVNDLFKGTGSTTHISLVNEATMERLGKELKIDADRTTRGFYDPNTDEVYINDKYSGEVAQIIKHEAISHAIIDSNDSIQNNVIDYIEKNFKEEYHKYDKQLEKQYNKNQIAYERLATFMENHIKDYNSFANLFSKNAVTKSKVIALLNRIANTFKTADSTDKVFLKQIDKAIRTLKESNVKSQQQVAYSKKLSIDKYGKVKFDGEVFTPNTTNISTNEVQSRDNYISEVGTMLQNYSDYEYDSPITQETMLRKPYIKAMNEMVEVAQTVFEDVYSDLLDYEIEENKNFYNETKLKESDITKAQKQIEELKEFCEELISEIESMDWNGNDPDYSELENFVDFADEFLTQADAILGDELQKYIAQEKTKQETKEKEETKKEEKKPVKAETKTEKPKGLVRSPITYQGNKYDLLKTILPKFPSADSVNTFYDAFSGSLTVSLNVDYKNIVANDLSETTYGVQKIFKDNTPSFIEKYIFDTISKNELRTEKGFYRFVSKFNAESKTEKYHYLNLYILQKLSTNRGTYLDDAGRFEGMYDPNGGFKDRKLLRKNITAMCNAVKSMSLENGDAIDIIKKAKSGDFIYVDPPYLNTNAEYNKNGGWTSSMDVNLMAELDNATKRGVKWAMSNALEYNQITNEFLRNWMKKYEVEHIDKKYFKGSADEILVRNYTDSGEILDTGRRLSDIGGRYEYKINNEEAEQWQNATLRTSGLENYTSTEWRGLDVSSRSGDGRFLREIFTGQVSIIEDNVESRKALNKYIALLNQLQNKKGSPNPFTNDGRLKTAYYTPEMQLFYNENVRLKCKNTSFYLQLEPNKGIAYYNPKENTISVSLTGMANYKTRTKTNTLEGNSLLSLFRKTRADFLKEKNPDLYKSNFTDKILDILNKQNGLLEKLENTVAPISSYYEQAKRIIENGHRSVLENMLNEYLINDGKAKYTKAELSRMNDTLVAKLLSQYLARDDVFANIYAQTNKTMDLLKQNNVLQVSINKVVNSFTDTLGKESRQEIKLSKPLDADSEPLVSAIEHQPYFGNIRQWKNFNKLTYKDLKIVEKIAFGNSVSLDELLSLSPIAEAEEYIKQNPQLIPSEHPDLVESAKKDFKETILSKEDNLKRHKKMSDWQVKKDRKALIVIGRPSAGKSSGNLNGYIANGYVEFDNDIAKGVKSLSSYYQDGIGANTVHEIVSEAQAQLQDEMISDGYNLAIPMVGSKTSKVLRLLSNLSNNNYSIEIEYIDLRSDEALKRATTRFLSTNRYVNLPYIQNIENKIDIVYNELVDIVKNGASKYGTQTLNIDRLEKIDNNGNAPKSIELWQSKEFQESHSRINREGLQRNGSGVNEGLSNESTNDRNNSVMDSSRAIKLSKPLNNPTYKSMDTTKDIVELASEKINQRLGTDYKVRYPKNFESFSHKAFSQINSVVSIEKEATRLVNLLKEVSLDAYDENTKTYVNVGTLGSLMNKTTENRLTQNIRQIIRTTPNTDAKSRATKSFEMSIDSLLDSKREIRNKLDNVRVITNLRNKFRQQVSRNYQITEDAISRDGLKFLFKAFAELHGGNGFKAQGVANNINEVLSWYNEETLKKNYPNLPYEDAIRNKLIELRDSIGEPVKQIVTLKDGTKQERMVYGSLTATSLQLAKETMQMIDHLHSQVVKNNAQVVLPSAEQSYKVISESDYGKVNNVLAKVFRSYKRGFAPSYVVIREMLGGNSQLADIVTRQVQDAINKKTLYLGNYNNAINKKLKEFGIRKKLDKKFDFEGFELTADQMMNLYISLNVEANYNAINDNGVQFYDKNGQLKTLSGKGNAEYLKAKVKQALPEGYRNMGDWLLATMNSSVKAEYIDFYTKKFGEFNNRNEIGSINENTYWMLNRSYQRFTNAEKLVKNPNSIFTHAKARVNNENQVLLGGALSGFTSYITALSNELFVKPVYRDALAVINTKLSNGSSIAQLLADKTSKKDVAYLQTTLEDILGINQANGDLLTGIMARFSVAKLSLNIGTMLKQFLSIYTSNIPLRQSAKGLIHNIFKNDAVKTEMNMLLDEKNGLGGLKYRSNGSTVVQANADGLTGRAEDIAKIGMVGISAVDLFTINTGVISLMYMVENEYGYKVGTTENAEMVKQHWADFELSQIGSSALSRNAVARGDYQSLVKALFGFLQGANRANLGSQINKIDLYKRNKGLDKSTLEDNKKNADNKVKNFESKHEDLSNLTDEERTEYVDLKQNQIDADSKLKDYERYEMAGGKSIPVNMVAGLMVQGLFVAMITELMKHIKGKKDWDEWDIAELGTSVGLAIGVDWIPLVNTLSNLIKGYEVNVPAVDLLNQVGSIINSGKSGNWNVMLRQIAIVVGDACGIPFETVYSYLYGAMKTFNPEVAYEMNSVLYGATYSNANKTLKKYAEKNDLGKTKSMVNVIMQNYKMNGVSERVSTELSKLYISGYNALPKSYITEYADDKGNTVKLSQKQVNTFKSIYSQSDNAVKSVLSLTEYSTLTQEEKAKVVKKIYDAYYSYAKAFVTRQSADSRLSQLLVDNSGNIDIGKYVLYLNKINSISESKMKTRKELVFQYVNSISGLSRNEKLLLLNLAGYTTK